MTKAQKREAKRSKSVAASANRPKGYVLVSAPVQTTVDPELIADPRILRNREWVTALAATWAFENWLRRHCALHQIPMDSAGAAVELLTLYVECELVDRATHPGDFVTLDEEPDAPGLDHVDADRLTMVEPRDRPERRDCVMPGCQGESSPGVRCQRMRPYGQKFCPVCEQAELKRLRAVRGG